MMKNIFHTSRRYTQIMTALFMLVQAPIFLLLIELYFPTSAPQLYKVLFGILIAILLGSITIPLLLLIPKIHPGKGEPRQRDDKKPPEIRVIVYLSEGNLWSVYASTELQYIVIDRDEETYKEIFSISTPKYADETLTDITLSGISNEVLSEVLASGAFNGHPWYE